ncbi:membrane protein [Candidatus Magnetomorum sp. HK-1]|nr:membrane protein [Candidatus Magnetomorum sp. HK-1]
MNQLNQLLQSFIKHQNLFFIVLGVILCIIGASGDMSFANFSLKLPDITGRLITVIVSLLLISFGLISEWRLKSEKADEISQNENMTKGFDIISKHINAIEDKEIKNKSILIINEAKSRLRRIDDGIVVLGPEHTYRTAIDNIRTTKKGENILATHAAHEHIDYLYGWEDIIPLKNYFAENIKAINRGVNIERIFIIMRDAIFDSQTSTIKNERALKILRDHEDAGIHVYITWFENILLNKNMISDFIIFDKFTVESHDIPAGGLYYQVTIRRNVNEIIKYTERFNEIKNSGLPLKKALNEIGINI